MMVEFKNLSAQDAEELTLLLRAHPELATEILREAQQAMAERDPDFVPIEDMTCTAVELHAGHPVQQDLTAPPPNKHDPVWLAVLHAPWDCSTQEAENLGLQMSNVLSMQRKHVKGNHAKCVVRCVSESSPLNLLEFAVESWSEDERREWAKTMGKCSSEYLEGCGMAVDGPVVRAGAGTFVLVVGWEYGTTCEGVGVCYRSLVMRKGEGGSVKQNTYQVLLSAPEVETAACSLSDLSIGE
jgi:hypothetical protein